MFADFDPMKTEAENIDETLALMRELPVLSIRQPWATSIVLGGKRVENRVWSERHPSRRFRGRFLIHASKEITDRDEALWRDTVANRACSEAEAVFSELERLRHEEPMPYTWIPSQTGDWLSDRLRLLPRGGIIGMARVVDVVTESDSPWFTGPIALVLEDVRPLAFVSCKGALGFFRAEGTDT
jgi:hypothetical protein